MYYPLCHLQTLQFLFIFVLHCTTYVFVHSYFIYISYYKLKFYFTYYFFIYICHWLVVLLALAFPASNLPKWSACTAAYNLFLVLFGIQSKSVGRLVDSTVYCLHEAFARLADLHLVCDHASTAWFYWGEARRNERERDAMKTSGIRLVCVSLICFLLLAGLFQRNLRISSTYYNVVRSIFDFSIRSRIFMINSSYVFFVLWITISFKFDYFVERKLTQIYQRFYRVNS